MNENATIFGDSVHFSVNLCTIGTAIDSTEFSLEFRNLNRIRCLTAECTVVLIHGTKRIPVKIQMLNS